MKLKDSVDEGHIMKITSKTLKIFKMYLFIYFWWHRVFIAVQAFL